MNNKELRNKVTIGNMILIFCYMCFTVGGLVLFKLGSQKSLSVGVSNGTLNASINLYVILGMFLYVCSFLVYLFLVSKFDLSYIMPLSTGLVAVMTIVAATVIFHETLTIIKIVGICMVIGGTILINIKK